MKKSVIDSYHQFEIILQTVENALQQARTHQNDELFEYLRDSVIQRIEYTIEYAWKLLKLILQDRDGITTDSPKKTIKEALKVGYITNLDRRLDMIESRNLSSHTYDISLVQNIYESSEQYYALLKNLSSKISHELSRTSNS